MRNEVYGVLLHEFVYTYLFYTDFILKILCTVYYCLFDPQKNSPPQVDILLIIVKNVTKRGKSRNANNFCVVGCMCGLIPWNSENVRPLRLSVIKVFF